MPQRARRSPTGAALTDEAMVAVERHVTRACRKDWLPSPRRVTAVAAALDRGGHAFVVTMKL